MGNRQPIVHRSIIHPQLGEVRVVVRRNASRIVARWKCGVVYLTVPPGTSSFTIDYTLHRLCRPLLDKRADELHYDIGMIVDVGGVKVEIKRQRTMPDAVLMSTVGDRGYFEVGRNVDLHSLEGVRRISDMLCAVARKLAPHTLVDEAAKVAERVGVAPSRWLIMRGARTLGKCTSAGEIHLSYMMLFLTPELRDYIVCHELAHLTEMNHSPRFHKLCDSYCGGREKELAAALRAYRWPVLR